MGGFGFENRTGKKEKPRVFIICSSRRISSRLESANLQRSNRRHPVPVGPARRSVRALKRVNQEARMESTWMPPKRLTPERGVQVEMSRLHNYTLIDRGASGKRAAGCSKVIVDHQTRIGWESGKASTSTSGDQNRKLHSGESSNIPVFRVSASIPESM